MRTVRELNYSLLRIIICVLIMTQTLPLASACPFAPAHVISSDAKAAQDVAVGDLDNDNDLDVVYATGLSPVLYWQENLVNGTFANAISIDSDSSLKGARSVELCDLNGDGALDVVAVIVVDRNYDPPDPGRVAELAEVVWYQSSNLTMGTIIGFQAKQVIATNVLLIKDTPSKTILCADVDYDSDLDVVLASRDALVWMENVNGTFAEVTVEQATLVRSETYISIRAAHLGDAPADPYIDIVAGSLSTGGLHVFLNEPSNPGTFMFESHGIPALLYYVELSDFDNDGDVDIVSAVVSLGGWIGAVGYHKWIGGTVSLPQSVQWGVDFGAYDMASLDYDNDGDQDVVVVAWGGNFITLFENDNGTLVVIPVSVEAYDATSVSVGDINNDGFMDLVVTTEADRSVRWFESGGGVVTFDHGECANVPQCPFANEAELPQAKGSYLQLADIDQSSSQLEIVLGRDKLKWLWKNDTEFVLGGVVAPGLWETLQNYFVTTDVDNDSDIDVVGVDSGDTEDLYWYENTDGMHDSTFKFAHLILADVGPGNVVVASHVDSDAFVDVILCTSTGVQWFKNNGNLTFSAPNVVVTSAIPARALVSFDMDLQNGNDLVYLDAQQHVVYMKNTDGNGVFDPPAEVYRAKKSFSIAACAINNDAYIDIVVKSKNSVLWFKNNNGVFELFPRWLAADGVLDGNAQFINSHVRCADVDNDGDHDVLVYSQGDTLISLFENMGAGVFGERVVVAVQAGYTINMEIGDVDGDGVVDLVYGASGKPRWRRGVLCTPAPTTTPTHAPTHAPISPTISPTRSPTHAPTTSPTRSPHVPTISPTRSPTRSPTHAPTSPTQSPTQAPTPSPIHAPTTSPTPSPTQAPTPSPTQSSATTTQTTTTTITSTTQTHTNTPNNMVNEPSTDMSTLLFVVLGVLCLCVVLVVLLAIVIHRSGRRLHKATHKHNNNNNGDYAIGSPRSVHSPRGMGAVRSPRVTSPRRHNIYGGVLNTNNNNNNNNNNSNTRRVKRSSRRLSGASVLSHDTMLHVPNRGAQQQQQQQQQQHTMGVMNTMNTMMSEDTQYGSIPATTTPTPTTPTPTPTTAPQDEHMQYGSIPATHTNATRSAPHETAELQLHSSAQAQSYNRMPATRRPQQQPGSAPALPPEPGDRKSRALRYENAQKWTTNMQHTESANGTEMHNMGHTLYGSIPTTDAVVHVPGNENVYSSLPASAASGTTPTYDTVEALPAQNSVANRNSSHVYQHASALATNTSGDNGASANVYENASALTAKNTAILYGDAPAEDSSESE